MENNKIGLGTNLKRLREEAGYSQEELAIKIGVQKAAISKYEKGLTEPKLTYLILFAELFNVTLDELILADGYTLDINKNQSANKAPALFNTPQARPKISVQQPPVATNVTQGSNVERWEKRLDDLMEENKMLVRERDQAQKQLIFWLEEALKKK